MTIPTDDMVAAGVPPAIIAAFEAVNAALEAQQNPLKPATMEDLARISAEVHRLREAVAASSNGGAVAAEAREIAQETRDMVSAITVAVAMADDDHGVGGDFDAETSTIRIRLPSIGSDINLHSQQW